MDKKKQLYESIMHLVSKLVKMVLNEYRTKKEDNFFEDNSEKALTEILKVPLVKWLQDKVYEKSGSTINFDSGWSLGPKLILSIINNDGIIYKCRIRIHNAYDEPHNIQTWPLYKALEIMYQYIKSQKEFKITSATLKTKYSFEFEYDIKKDKDLNDDLTAAKLKFENEVNAANTDEYAPTKRDWMKMIDYMDGHSNAERVANSCKDNHKIVSRYIIAKVLGWEEAIKAFKDKILKEHILTEAELEAYVRRYGSHEMPPQVAKIIDNYKKYNGSGAFATSDENNHVEILPENVKYFLSHNDDVTSYFVELTDETIPIKQETPTRRWDPYRKRFMQVKTFVDTYIKANLAIFTIKFYDGQEMKLWYAYLFDGGRYKGTLYNYEYKPAWTDYRYTVKCSTSLIKNELATRIEYRNVGKNKK